jgi:hypothetical protein
VRNTDRARGPREWHGYCLLASTCKNERKRDNNVAFLFIFAGGDSNEGGRVSVCERARIHAQTHCLCIYACLRAHGTRIQ